MRWRRLCSMRLRTGLERQYPQIEDVLPLSPLQEGLLFHALYDAQAPDLYTVQLELGLEGALDSEALEAAAEALLGRHASLRAAFQHERLRRPVQIIVPRAQPRKHGLTLNTFMQTAWAILLGRMTGRDDVVFGVTVAGRPSEIAGIESMVGLFINTLPLRVDLAPAKPLLDLLKQVQDSQSRLMAYQHVGLAEIQQLAGLGELFDTLVVFENYPVDRSSLRTTAESVRLSQVSGHDATHYPLSLMIAPAERLQLRLDYRADLFDRASVEALAGRYVRLLQAAVATPEVAIGRLELLSGEERRRILQEWNATARALEPRTVAQLFAAQAAQTPDAVAVEIGRASCRERV